ncbi:Cytochrome P450 monooxygenase 88 [Psilocybe cubensis]|uniref:Cytochrome P450 monooxygenase 88 n=1 Tax=Psilocybe cubensis TaxID=181762 RepID=A0ACB8HHF0_PSICU|nr:Cytochrome P450 monooxygenase 88 [Psilocybe cubensis]KAH9487458.1 Cytochrome P450 monooxygenase 88 [Psilocybe cubensis]
MSLVQIAMQPQTIAMAALCLTLLAFIHHRLTRSSKLPLPPGPPGNLIFGNSIPKAFAYRHFETWTQEYGPVFTLRQGFNTIIVIGRMQAAIDILEKEGAATVDRPLSIAAGETLSGGMRMLLTPAGERFKKMRRALHAHLQPKIVSNYAPTLMRNAKQHIMDIIDEPHRHQDHAKRYSAAVVMALAYGKQAKSYEDPDIQAVNRCLTRLGNNLRPGMWKVDAYPFLRLTRRGMPNRYVPGYLKELQDGHKEELNLFKSQIYEVKMKMERGEEVLPSFGKYLLERQKELDLSDDEMAYLAGSMFGAGSDTTASAISVTVLAAACHPEAHKRVQEELDAVVGRSRPPTIADQEMLPQTMAFVLESVRWRPVSAGGFAHKAIKDIVWGNYVIPKGASVIGNVWSVGRDPEFFPDPETFNPQRWLTEGGKLRDDLKSYSFGFGRRSIFVNAALIQWAFKISSDPSSPIDPLAFTESANTHPLPFKVIFEPRIASSMEATKELFEDYGL